MYAKRPDFSGHVVHAMNRRVDRRLLFRTNEDYAQFRSLLSEAQHRHEMRILEWVLMPNHWHMLLWPDSKEQLPKFMNWLSSIHAKLFRENTNTVGEGAVYQSRYRAFPVSPGVHLARLRNYLAMNPVVANLVENSYDWMWGSAKRAVLKNPVSIVKLDKGPLPHHTNLVRLLSEQIYVTSAEKQKLDHSLVRGMPYGDNSWIKNVVDQLSLHALCRGRGRPKKLPRG